MAILTSRPVVSKIVLVALAALTVSACSSTRPVERTAPRAYFTAPVFPGDSLATFAQRYNVQPNEILALNTVKERNGRLTRGQLKVPAHARSRAERTALPVQPAVATTPRVTAIQPRPASIETRSLMPVPVTSTRNASVTTNGLDTQKTAPAAAVTASHSPQPPAAEMPWYDWLMPSSPPSPAGADAERFLWPVEGRVISPFGDNPNGGRNDGINISVARGTPVRAAESGEVSYVGNELKGYGNLILIRHDNGFVTAYAHADSVHVKRGERVERGQVIGSAGDTGDVSQPQLHFELRHGTQPVDPTPYLVASPNRPPSSSSERLAEGTR